MKLQMIYIRNIVANVAEFAPMFVHHLGMAVRDFGDQCQDEQLPLGKHPADYELFHAGEWDDIDFTLKEIKPHKQLAVGSNYTNRTKTVRDAN